MEKTRSTVVFQSVFGVLSRLRAGVSAHRPTLVKADGSLLIVIDSGHCLVVPDFFRTGGSLRWDRSRESLIWHTGPGEEQVFALPSAPDLSSIGLGLPRKSSGKAWALGIAVFLILPALWVHLLTPTPGPGLRTPSRFAPGGSLAPGVIPRLSGTGWMK